MKYSKTVLVFFILMQLNTAAHAIDISGKYTYNFATTSRDKGLVAENPQGVNIYLGARFFEVLGLGLGYSHLWLSSERAITDINAEVKAIFLLDDDYGMYLAVPIGISAIIKDLDIGLSVGGYAGAFYSFFNVLSFSVDIGYKFRELSLGQNNAKSKHHYIPISVGLGVKI